MSAMPTLFQGQKSSDTRDQERLRTGMYDYCHCDGVKRNCAIRCAVCQRKERATRMGKVEPTIRFQDEWLGLEEMHALISADIAKWKLGIAQLADKAGCDTEGLSNFLGRRGPLPKAIAAYYGFRKASAWVRL